MHRGFHRGLCLALILPLAVNGQLAVHRLFTAIREGDNVAFSNALPRVKSHLQDVYLKGHVTPLHLAAALDRATMVEALLEQGVWIDAPTAGGFTPLHWAVAMDSTDAAAILIAKGANGNLPAQIGITPLHWAGSRNATNCIALLIRHGVRIDGRTDNGLTPLHWAVAQEREDAAMMLAFRLVDEGRDMLPVTAAETNLMPGTNDALSVTLPLPDHLPNLATSSNAPIVLSPAASAPMPRHGDIHSIDLGGGQLLSFTWIETAGVWFGKFEVTNGQFRRFRPAHDSGMHEGISLNDDDRPVVNVSWHDATTFCEWINSVHRLALPQGTTCRLPQDTEWRTAARCGTSRTYPWGNNWPPLYGNHADEAAREVLRDWQGIENYNDGYPATCPVEESGANEWGIYGLSGNVWEWCDDWYDKPRRRVRKGGGWGLEAPESLTVDIRGFDAPDARYDTIGFRVVLAPVE